MLEDETGKIGSLMCESLSQRIIPIVLELSVYSNFFDGNGCLVFQGHDKSVHPIWAFVCCEMLKLKKIAGSVRSSTLRKTITFLQNKYCKD